MEASVQEASNWFWETVARHANASAPIGPAVLLKDEYDDGASESVLVGTLLSSAQLGLSTGVLLTLFLRHKLTRIKEGFVDYKVLAFLKTLRQSDVRRFVFVLATFVEFLLLSPVFLAVYLTFKALRLMVAHILRQRYGEHFKGFLEGADVVWAIEQENSRGMINIMAYIEKPSDESISSTEYTTPAEILLVLRKRISSRFMGGYRPYPKLFWKRCLELGYYYWSDQSDLSIEDYIRFLDQVPTNEATPCHLSEAELRTLLSKINNRHLPGSHSSSWEILVGRQPLIDTRRHVLRFPIIFRVHHSLGDGVALLRILMEGIVDKEIPSRWNLLSNFKVMNLDYILKEQINESETKHKKKELRILPTQKEFNAWKQRILLVLWTIVTAPAFFHEVSKRAIDDNCIHAAQLANEKVVSWIHEEETSGSQWINVIKRTKQQVPGARFSDAFLTALSASLQKYFARKSAHVPKNITVVLPTRIEKEASQIKLHNRFSVALQTLPIAEGILRDDTNQYHSMLSRLREVKKHSDALRSSPDYMINYWIMSTIGCLFPDPILRKILTSAHSTLAISNLPGPQQKPRIQGNELKDLCFWIPNIGQTAVGLTLLTYGGKIQLGILADRAVIPSEEDAHSILSGMVEEIERMGAVLEAASS